MGKNTTIKDEIQCLLVQDFLSRHKPENIETLVGVLTTLTNGITLHESFHEGLVREDFYSGEFYDWLISKTESIDKILNQYRKFKRMYQKSEEAFLETLETLKSRTNNSKEVGLYRGALLFFELVPVYMFNYAKLRAKVEDVETLVLLEAVMRFVINFLVVSELPKKTDAVTEKYVITLLNNRDKDSNEIVYGLFKKGIYI